MKAATANLIVRNAGGTSASDAALLAEARATGYFQESDAELLAILHAVQRRLKGAALGGIRGARKRAQRKEDRAALVESFAAQVLEAAAAAKARKGTPGWRHGIDRRVDRTIAAARKSGDYVLLLALERELRQL